MGRSNWAGRRWTALLAMAAAVAALGWPAARAAPSVNTVIANVDLSQPFGTRSAWRLVATQGPQVTDPIAGQVPGSIVLCLETSDAGPCDPAVAAMPQTQPGGWDAHYLLVAQVVYPRGRSAPPLLLVRTGSLLSGDGDQAVYTQLFAYRRATDRFAQAYGHVTGHNNNEEVRFIASGPLQGSVIAAEPTANSPYGYWISVSKLTPSYTYAQVLRYRSATRYGDGNSLAVIDSEMPNIESRLGLWRPGAPLPLPAGPCPKPRLTAMELWCN